MLSASDPVCAGFLDAQLAYARVVFGPGPRPGDAGRARAGFGAAAADERLAGWGSFWLGVLAENVDDAPDQAAAAYGPALADARRRG